MEYKFTLSSDSTCDLYHDFVVENDIKFAPLTFMLEKDGKMEDYLDNFTEYSEYVDFYNKLRAGWMPKTSKLNYEAHYTHFRKMAEEGAKDVVHFTISSGLANTWENAEQAAADVKKDFPDFRVFVVDPLTATVGQGALVRLALKCRNEGKTAEEAAELCKSVRLHIQHFIVADDLQFLKRGGRISAASAAIVRASRTIGASMSPSKAKSPCVGQALMRSKHMPASMSCAAYPRSMAARATGAEMQEIMPPAGEIRRSFRISAHSATVSKVPAYPPTSP